MARSQVKYPQDFKEDEDKSESSGLCLDSEEDSEMEDPDYDFAEETRRHLSTLSVSKKSNSRYGGGVLQDPPEADEVDQKSYETVVGIVQGGQLERLKVEQCKVYLRKNGLRLTGNKDTLIQRIREHQEILNGEGEKKYPVSTFVINCKGDSCMGDVVMFEQNVYELYSVVSRSASGPPCGTRVIAGRIVKESYGAAKQQHTFTIEVLWSKGEKPLPPLHPLLIKGRNLYRLKTLRQRWEDEEERKRILMEKHFRGTLARCARETRVQEKEMKKILREKRALKVEKSNRTEHHPNPDWRDKNDVGQFHQLSEERDNVGQQRGCINHNQRGLNHCRPMSPSHRQPLKRTVNSCHLEQEKDDYQRVVTFSTRHENHSRIVADRWTSRNADHYNPTWQVYQQEAYRPIISPRHGYQFKSMEVNRPMSPPHRQPLRNVNHCRQMSPPRREAYQKKQLCKYYGQGRCYFGDQCKFLHQE